MLMPANVSHPSTNFLAHVGRNDFIVYIFFKYFNHVYRNLNEIKIFIYEPLFWTNYFHTNGCSLNEIYNSNKQNQT